MKTVIVEDSRPNRELILSLLGRHCSDVEVVGQAATLEEAEAQIEQSDPDLLLVDIQLPRGTIFDYLERKLHDGPLPWTVIFITAHGTFEYAQKAIALSALDYLTKPIDPAQLKAAVQRGDIF